MQDQSVFSRNSCYAVGQAQMAQARDEVARISESELSPEREAATLESLYKKYDLPPARIDRNGIKVSKRNDKLSRGTADQVEFQLPFDGDGRFFMLSPSTSNVLTNVLVRANHIAFIYSSRDQNPEQTRERFESDLQRFEETLALLVREAQQFNGSLKPMLQELIKQRQATITKKEGFLDGLGYPRA